MCLRLGARSFVATSPELKLRRHRPVLAVIVRRPASLLP
jgi:hypothetical protein